LLCAGEIAVAKFFLKKTDGLEKVNAHLAAAKVKMPEHIRDAHQHSSKHRSEILKSDLCGCFCCEQTFEAGEIVDWIDEQQTALCPKCGIDSVIGSASGFLISREFLHEMCESWFSTS
jgi:hypothetical protein